METATYLLDAIFAPTHEWQFPGHRIDIKRVAGADGSPQYTVSHDEVDVVVSEITKWAEGVKFQTNPHRLVVRVVFTGVHITDPIPLLKDSYNYQALPAYGINGDGNLALNAGFPVEPSVPVECLRKQLILCVCLIAERATKLLRIWNREPPPETAAQANNITPPQERQMSEFRCSNCNARIHESTFRERNGMCWLCSNDPDVAAHRRKVGESQKAKGILNPKCASCGISESEQIRQHADAEKSGASIYMKDFPPLLYCENCGKYFCGRCQADIGGASGCPECRTELDQ